MVKNRQNSQLSLDVSNNRPIIAKYRETSAEIFVKKFVGSDFRMFLFWSSALPGVEHSIVDTEVARNG